MKSLQALFESAYGRYPFFKVLGQFVRFGLVGIANTLISLGVYWICYYAFHLHYQISNIIGFVVSVTNAYYWNNRYVFRDHDRKDLSEHLKTYGKVFACYGLTYFTGAILLVVWVERLGISPGLAPVINLLITIPLNFLLNKFWAFR